MQTTDTVLAIHQERGVRGLPLERVYQHLFDPELFLRAYGKIYRNAGAMTKGSTEETVDGMSLQKIHDIIALLRQETIRVDARSPDGNPQGEREDATARHPDMERQARAGSPADAPGAVLRTAVQRPIPMASGPNGGATRLSGRSRGQWKGTVWFIEGDIKGCFDNIDHAVLLEIIRRDIHDGRLVQLIGGLLKAGYMEDWRYHDTLSGTPQGGIISPLLANIYLNELDRFVEDTLIPAYTRGETRKANPEYTRSEGSCRTARKTGRPR